MNPRVSVSICLMLGAAFLTLSGQEPQNQDDWSAAVEDLRSDEFAVRQKAAARLSKLSEDQLPWLYSKLDEAREAADPEFLQGLAGAVRSIKERVSREKLENGLPVTVELVDVGSETVLGAIQSHAPRKIIRGRELESLKGSGDDADFNFTGNYWSAVDAYFKTYPPAVASTPKREAVDEEQDLSIWGESDFAGIAQPRAIAGILHVRAPLTAVENSNGTDYFTVTLVPKIEPSYQPESLEILLKGVELADGSVLVPESRKCSFESSGFRGNTSYHPGRDFTWSIPLKADFDRSGPARLDALVRLKVHRVEWETRDLPALGEKVSLNDNISVKVEEKDETSIELEFSGDDGTSIDFNRYTRRGGNIRLFDLIDADGEVIDFRVGGSGTSSDGDRWSQSYRCRIGDAKAVSVRALVPGEQLEVQMPLVIEGVPVPGMTGKK